MYPQLSNLKILKQIFTRVNNPLNNPAHNPLNSDIPPTAVISQNTQEPSVSTLPSHVSGTSAQYLKRLQPSYVSVPSPKKLKTDCSKCVTRRMEVNKLVSKNRKHRLQVQKFRVSSDEVKKLNQALWHKVRIEKNLRSDRKYLKTKIMKKEKQTEFLKNKLNQFTCQDKPAKNLEKRNTRNLIVSITAKNLLK